MPKNLRINFLVNEVDGGWEPTDKRLGGTEESVVRWAEELAKRGHKVLVYRNGKTKEPLYNINGVDYHPREWYLSKLDNTDITINIKSSDIAPKEPTLYLTNETDATDKDLSKYLGVIWPSQWAVDNIPVNNRTFILPHGYDSEKIYPGEKVSKQCLYASSPDRGLDTLLRAWPSVVRVHPDAMLVVTYGAQEYSVPGVTFVDADEDQMNELYRTSDIWAYPCNGGELYCMTGIKAQAAGCVPVYFPVMALAETVLQGYPCNPDTFIDVLNMALSDQGGKTSGIRKRLTGELYPNWQDSTDQLLEIVNMVL